MGFGPFVSKEKALVGDGGCHPIGSFIFLKGYIRNRVTFWEYRSGDPQRSPWCSIEVGLSFASSCL